MRSNSRPMGTPSPIATVNTYHDNPEQYARVLPIAPPAPGLITEAERAAELALEVGEVIAEGLSPWALASHAVAVIATCARALRARR